MDTTQLVQGWQAGYGVASIHSHEEEAAVYAVTRTAADEGREVGYWNVATGLRPDMHDGAALPETGNPIEALAACLRLAKDGRPRLIIFVDLSPYLHGTLEDKRAVRLIKELAHLHQPHFGIVLIDTPWDVPDELLTEIHVIDWPLPDQQTLEKVVVQRYATHKGIRIKPELRERLAFHLKGLPRQQASRVLAMAHQQHPNLSDSLDTIVQAKRSLIEKGGLLEFVDLTADMSDLGGLDLLKAHIGIVARSFEAEAQAAGVQRVRGMLLAGPTGTGKSTACMVVAAEMGWPLIRLSLGRVFNSLLGSTEARMRVVQDICVAYAPAVIQLEEVGNMLGGGHFEHDGGTAGRVMQSLLTWMEEATASVPLLFVATSNSVSGLSPQLLRRLGEPWALLLPALPERVEIARIHFRASGLDPDDYDVEAIGEASARYSPAELRDGIVLAAQTAYAASEPLTTEHILQAFAIKRPLADTQPDMIARQEEEAMQFRIASTRYESVSEGRAVTSKRKASLFHSLSAG